MIPDHRQRILTECANGNAPAADFLRVMYEFLHLIDDLVDLDVTPEPSDEVIGFQCVQLILTIGSNPFYQANKHRLEPLIEQAFSAWLCANRLEREKKIQGKVLKSWYHEIFWHVARLTGGWEHMRRVCRTYRDFDLSQEEVPRGLLR